MDILRNLIRKKKEGIKSFAVLIDPDKILSESEVIDLVNQSNESIVDIFFVGGSLITSQNISQVVATIKQHCNIPVILFPGNSVHVDLSADAILFLSLISGRNPEFLIGQHVVAAPMLKSSRLEVIPCGYMLVGNGNKSAARYMSNTDPIPRKQGKIAAATALAGQMLGLKLIYLDAGSGATKPVPPKMIQRVASSVDLPIIVGGGIDNLAKVSDALNAQADLVVIGNKIEENASFLYEVSDYVRNWNESVVIR